MLKNKLKIIALLIIVSLCLIMPNVRAENETPGQTTENPDIETANEASNSDADNTTENVESGSESSLNNIKKEDIYIIDNDVTIDYIVDGNLFIIANNVTINSQIGGDAFIIAKTINIETQGYIFSNLFAYTEDLTISGIVYDLFTSAQNVTINGYIYRDIRVSTNNLNINGIIGRNAFVSASNIQFAETSSEGESTISNRAIINGNFNYSSPQEVSIPSREAVGGNINFNSMPKYDNNIIQEYILSFGKFVITAIIIWLLCLWLTPKFLKNAHELLSKKLLPVIGYGILTPIIITIAFIVLLLLGITSKVALLGLGLLLLLIAISASIFVIAINLILCEKLKIEKIIQTFGMLIISSTVIWLLTLIPYVGIFLKLIFSILGLGIIIKNIIPPKKNNNA